MTTVVGEIRMYVYREKHDLEVFSVNYGDLSPCSSSIVIRQKRDIN